MTTLVYRTLFLLALPAALSAQKIVLQSPKTPVLTAVPTAPAGEAPTGIRVGATPTSVTLKWICPSGASGYEVFATPASGGAQTKLTATPIPPQCLQDLAAAIKPIDPRLPQPTQTVYLSGFTHSGLANGSEFVYVVRALYATGAIGDAAPVTGKTAPYPVPLGVAATSPGKSATISWQPVTGSLGYHVLRQLQGETAPRQITTSPLTTTSFRDDAIGPNTSYSYVVRALFANGGTGDSGPLTGKTPLLQAPASFAVAGGGLGATLSWQAVPGAAGYTVFRQLHGESAFRQVATLAASATGHVDGGLVAAQQHRYYVQAVDGHPSATVLVLAGKPVGLAPQVYRGKPTVDFRWGGTETATSYSLFRSYASPSGPWTLVPLDPGHQKGWNRDLDGGKVGGTTYYKYVFAYPMGLVESDVLTAVIATPPQGITNLVGTSPGPGTVRLTWTCDPEARGYAIMRGKGLEPMDHVRPPGSTIPLEFTQCEYTDTGLWDGATYRYNVIGRYPDRNTSTLGHISVKVGP